MSIEINGLEDIKDKLDGLVDPIKLKTALGRACAIVERSAKEKAPKGNGDLRRSIKSKIDGDKGVIYTPLEYAPYVEYGTGLFAEEGGRKDVPWSYQDDKGEWHSTSGMKPSPYMRPALYDNRENVKRILREGLLND